MKFTVCLVLATTLWLNLIATARSERETTEDYITKRIRSLENARPDTSVDRLGRGTPAKRAGPDHGQRAHSSRGRPYNSHNHNNNHNYNHHHNDHQYNQYAPEHGRYASDEQYDTAPSDNVEHRDNSNSDEQMEQAAESKHHEHTEKTKVKHHHHHHHHNHVKTIVKKEPYPVEKIVEKIVHVPKPYPVEKIIEVKVPVEKIVHVPQPYPVEKIVEKKVPYEVKVPYPVEKIVHVPKPYPVIKHIHVPVEVKVPVHVPYPVEKKIPYPVEVKVPYEVEKKVHIPIKVEVEKKVPYPVKVYVPQPYPVEKKVHVPVEIDYKDYKDVFSARFKHHPHHHLSAQHSIPQAAISYTDYDYGNKDYGGFDTKLHVVHSNPFDQSGAASAPKKATSIAGGRTNSGAATQRPTFVANDQPQLQPQPPTARIQAASSPDTFQQQASEVKPIAYGPVNTFDGAGGSSTWRPVDLPQAQHLIQTFESQQSAPMQMVPFQLVHLQPAFQTFGIGGGGGGDTATFTLNAQ